MSDEEDLRTTQDSLTILLSDDSAFESALNAIYEAIDTNGDGRLDPSELERYIGRACAKMGVDGPAPAQVAGVFKQLDLNNDRDISREELSVFLRHFFQEQVKYCALKLRAARR
ncbi:hypothetical protein CHLRE_08g385100v5 [Chlamydomonas reinhardtii]|uniref:EF-hand domain-containing protein n=1 Tax=Chlamydomonas reinhardtii TaxID=3055 RepID=A0A2K3DIC5_CHLRE|nr:uncharacterized protein CHLRE_08g385100v5 [Chlamydomonas reinhardtii]PNW80277.1 hypothetical protein CHLRE_08g385100v5 [Chlamydomonas reinhardtii]